MDKLEKIFKIMSFFDDFRWQKEENYNLINFFDKNIDDDSKILTHWLCYITDRQMPFEIIWDVGGFVLSEIVHEIKNKKNLNKFNPNDNDSYLNLEENKKYYFLSKNIPNKIIIENYSNYIFSNKVQFKSRFLPADYMCILGTLIILEDFNFNLAEYISYILKNNKGEKDIIIRIIFSLFLLSYYDIGQPNSEDISNYEKNIDKLNIRKSFILTIINEKKIFNANLEIFKKNKMFKQKRAWCSLRDFIKSKEFNKYFTNAMLKYVPFEDISLLTHQESLNQFVLPGDVWNNNSKFKKCILKNTKYENKKNDLNIILDTYFRTYKPKIGYPEQFDITFDFVPRMCEKNNCDICPLNAYNEYQSFSKICINQCKKYCTVALYACNYKNNCIGRENCKLYH